MLEKELIKQLRELTGASIMDVKRALEEANGDLDKAIHILKAKGLRVAEKKMSRLTKEGVVECYIHSNKKIGVLLELLCETDFVARNELFQKLAHEIAMHIAAMNPKYLNMEDVPRQAPEEKELVLLSQPFIKNPDQIIEDLIKEHIAKLGENIEIRRFIRFEI